MSTMPPLHPFIPVPGALRISLEGTQDGRPWANVFHAFYTGGPPTASNLHDYLSTWYGTAVGELAPLAQGSVLYTGAVATDLSSLTGAQVEVTGPTSGTNPGDLIPSNAAALVNYNSSFRYRGGHPRTYYVAGTQNELLDSNTWAPTFVTAVTTAAANVTAAFEVGATGFVVQTQGAISYYSGGVARVVPLKMPISTLSVSFGIATQRRRMRK